MHLMKEKIISLIQKNPRTYVQLIKKDAELSIWVSKNSKIIGM